MPMLSLKAEGHPFRTIVITSIAHGRYSMGISMNHSLVLLPRFSWAKV